SSSEARDVNVVTGSSNVVFTVQPQAVITALGEPLTNLKTVFTIENITKEPVQVSLTRAEINSSPFFTIVDPLGGGLVFVTLQPRQPKTFELRFAGPPTDRADSFQGIVIVSAPSLAV